MSDELETRAVDTGSWDGAAAMSDAASSDDPAAAYAAICAGRREGDPALQSSWALPHHAEPGMGCNADGVRNALSRLPQTEGLTNHDAAESHLQAHMAEVDAMMNRAEPEPLQSREIPAMLEVRDVARRELGIHIVPWDTIIQTNLGPEMFVNGAFDGIDPASVRLRMSHQDPPAGKGISLEQHAKGADMAFRVSKTQRGDEILTLAADGVASGASVGFNEVPGGSVMETINGRRVRVHRRVDLREVSTTWQPAYEQAAVTYIRSQEPVAEVAPVAEPEAPVNGAAPAGVDESAIVAAIQHGFESNKPNSDAIEKLTASIEKLEERQRAQFTVPSAQPEPKKVHGGQWLQYALAALSGDRISTNDMQYRDLADLVTSDNLGVVPDTFMQNELIGVIDPSRPFLSSTRRLPVPSSGMTLHVPKIITRPTVGLQSEEKAQISSTATSITTADFSAVTKAGGGDLSLQILKRSDPSFLDLYLRLLFEAYAMDSENEALAALLGDNVNDGNTIDPATATLGEAFKTAFSIIRRGPDTIWLSTDAVGAFIDAVSPITGMPLYSSITADFTVPGGITGSIKGLRPVHVPELGSLGADVIVGPSSGFAWAEDGTYTLQVDVPAKAGRDVAVVGILWFAPWYPEAFTVYTLES